MSGIVPSLQLRSVGRRYETGSRTSGLHSTDFVLSCGEAVLVQGPSGGGKSTFSRLVALWERPDRGHILVYGDEVSWQISHRYRGKIIGYISQQILLVPKLSVRDNLLLALRPHRLHPAESIRRVVATCAELGLRDILGQPVGTLSGGQAQRVAIARALAGEPDILVADEPTRSLDADCLALVRSAISSWHKARPRRSLLLVSHLAEDSELTSRTVTIVDGRLE
ncbi:MULTISPECIES: ATP-binding cassette domain-containing protein [Ferrimicrobium]|uniref:ATP-binding cassette domain-containing protein n=1 Tax=Ferrimicrobium TaxID=121038 RepID=UPI0023F3418A|nr:ATP-binding cassette domain-containing protein [Ferrimicrobium acidiphilum]